MQEYEDVTSPIEPRSSRTDGRTNSRVPGNYSHTTSHFAVPDASSEDELNAPRPTAPQQKAEEQKQRTTEGQAKSGKKRAAEHDGIGQQPMHLAKRRSDNTSKADLHRTIFTSAVTHTNSGHDGFRIDKAVCGPTYVYPAEGAMQKTMPGASNKPCRLVPVENRQSCFEVVDEAGKVIPELEWITPNMVKVNKIISYPNSGTVQLTKSQDFNAEFATGPVLYLDFGLSHVAEDYVKQCSMANPSIVIGTSRNIMQLINMMQHNLEKIMEYNLQKPPPPTTARPDDIQILEQNATRKMLTRLPRPQEQHSKNTAITKSIREQMQDNVTPKDEVLRPRHDPQRNLTPALEKQLRDVVEDDNEPGQQQRGCGNTEIDLRTPSSLNGCDSPRSQRSLRSNKATLSSPPPLERWTETNPNWSDEWKMDLVYERTTVGKGDIERLDEGQLLNDEIISFYIKYLHKQLEQKDEQLARKVYVFNSFFWDKLKPKRGDINYDGVKNWTAKVDLLSFDYIIVPINENAHWYLAIICNAKGLLHKGDLDSEAGVAVLKEDHDQAGDVTKNVTEDSVSKIAVDVSHISIDDESVDSKADQPGEDGKSPTGKGSKVSKKGPGLRKYDPRAPKVITLDSLGGPHSSVVTALKRYLQSEIKHKKGLDIEPPVSFGTTARDIPCQPNFTDCGVYLLGYMQEFMKDPDRFTSRILQSEKRDWDVDAPALRNGIRGLILRIQKEYQDKETQHRRQKALAAKKQAPSRPQTSCTSASKPSAASEQPAERPSSSSSAPATHTHQDTPPRAKSSPSRSVDREATLFRRGKHSSPVSAAGTRQEASSNQSDLDGHGTSNNIHNVSMIVNVDESFEMNGSESVSNPKVAAPQRPTRSTGKDGPNKRTAAPSRSPGRRHAPHSSEATASTSAAGVHSTSFLEPIPSSPESSDTITNKGDASRGGVKSGTSLGKAHTVSPFFQKSAQGNGSARKPGYSKKGRITKVEAISSSDAEEVDGKKDRKKPSPTIDLTSE
ncbi:hypothetical protein VPNG_02366 [Cytospora leucostoma]|uniref:Ubiquitin-like protease family profile domain-containing protein n=1 Tax=Cytospora leucostoma TaxID=1230097 RepID=A0A423XGN9_9PEZI|nr:hypothetical protein VPNG_02366 [Cytospora leucostoma]